MPDEHDIGPQSTSDPPFTARMRFHQSWYRARVLKVPCGVGPKPHSANRYGNMLREEDGDRGLNFLSPEIHALARQRAAENAGMVESFRLFHNMLSSQPMCFNLFGPWALDHDLATHVLKQILPGQVDHVTKVLFEHAPQPASEYLNDRTAFDAFVEYTRPDGCLGFIGIETKLTEPFSQKHYDGPSYRRWSDRVDSPWPITARDHLADVRHNQLWRDHLLAVAMRLHDRSPYADGYFMLVRHPLDNECATTVAGYRELLKPNDRTFLDSPLDALLEISGRAIGCGRWENWLTCFKMRYSDVPAILDENTR
jgi:hypothetical protein